MPLFGRRRLLSRALLFACVGTIIKNLGRFRASVDQNEVEDHPTKTTVQYGHGSFALPQAGSP